MRIGTLSGTDIQSNSITRTTRLATVGSVFLALCALLLWGISLRSIDLDRISDVGLVTALPLSNLAALFILTVGFALIVHQRQTQVPILLLYVILLILIIHGTPAILYGTLRYSWAWKHVGMVDYIQRHGSIDPGISVMSAYHNWPGFFALNAFLTESAGLSSALSFAAWAPVFFNLLTLGALLLILKSFTTDQRLVWLSIWFFFLTSWIGQDYFAPQALGYFFYLIVIGIVLRWFTAGIPPAKAAIKRWLLSDRLVSLVHRLFARAALTDLPQPGSRPFQRVGLMAIVFLLLAVIASSHQLTPFMTIFSLGALAVFQRTSARGLPIVMLILTIIWLVFGAGVFVSAEIADLIASFGHVTDTVESNLINLSKASSGQLLVAVIGRGLTVFLWGLALIGGIRRLRHGYWDLSAVLLALAPFGAFIASSYGGEVIFRVYLFALPFMAFFAAALVYSHPASGTSGRTVILTVLLSITLLTGFLFAYYGKERQYYFTKDEVTAAQYLYDTAPEGSLLIEGARNYPAQFRNYEFFTYVPIDREPPESRSNVIANPVEVLSRWMDNSEYAASYLIITRGQKAAVDALGQLPAGSLDHIEEALMQSQAFEVIFENEDATIFSLAAGAEGAGK